MTAGRRRRTLGFGYQSVNVEMADPAAVARQGRTVGGQLAKDSA